MMSLMLRQVSMFVEQVVKEESHIEDFPLDCSRIMVCHNMESLKFVLLERATKNKFTFKSLKILS